MRRTTRRSSQTASSSSPARARSTRRASSSTATSPPPTHQTFDNLAAILEAAGSSLDKVVKAGVYLADLGDFVAMNEVYKERMPAPHPARTTIQAAALPGGIRVEIDVIALA